MWIDQYDKAISSKPWAAPIAQLSDPSGMRCCRIADPGDGHWPECLAKAVLTDREWDTWTRRSLAEKRWRQWLLGRLVAKDAIRNIAKDRTGIALTWREIEISNDDYGRPFVCETLGDKLGYPLTMSISHSGDDVVAIAGERIYSHGVGIDVECASRDSSRLERIAFSAREQSFFSAATPPARQEWSLRLWCAKESVAKAVGRGMVGGPLGLVIEEVEVDSGRALVRLAGKLAQELPLYANKLFTVRSGRDSEVVFAVCDGN